MSALHVAPIDTINELNMLIISFETCKTVHMANELIDLNQKQHHCLQVLQLLAMFYSNNFLLGCKVTHVCEEPFLPWEKQ